MTKAHPPEIPKIIGHRGAAGHAPENTLASLGLAAALGARWVEFDVKLASGGEPILFHDDTLERTTDGKGKVATTSLAEIRRTLQRPTGVQASSDGFSPSTTSTRIER